MTPCSTLNELIPLAGTNGYVAHLLCDPWATPHVMGPMFLYLLIQHWPTVFLLTGLNEIMERVLIVLIGDFGIFPSIDSANDVESAVQQLVDDWLTQGGLGILIGGLFVYTIRSPVLWTGWRTNRRQWWFYAIVALFYFILSVLTSTTIDKPVGLIGASSTNVNRTDFWIGPYIVSVGWGGLVFLIQWSEPIYSSAWVTEPRWKRRWFWNGYYIFFLLFSLQSPWDWFYSGAAQTWLLSAISITMLLSVLVIQGRWTWAIRRFDSWADKWEIRDVA